MAFTLNNFKSALANKIQEAGTKEYWSEQASRAAISGAKVTGQTIRATQRAGEAVRTSLPVSTRRFESLASGLNVELKNVDREAFKARLVAQMVAEAAGVTIPDEETLDKLYQDEQNLQLRADRVAAETAEREAEEQKKAAMETIKTAKTEEKIAKDMLKATEKISKHVNKSDDSADVAKILKEAEDEMLQYISQKREEASTAKDIVKGKSPIPFSPMLNDNV